MNLHHLRIFYTVAQRRSITAAAEDLLLSQPAVSLQLKALEKELGMPLVQRGGPELRLTQAGEVLYRSAVSILHAKEEVERSIGELRDGTKGRVVLGSGTTGGMYVLPRIVQAYKGLWPETEVIFHIGTTDHILERLLENVVDMGLVGGPIDDRRFVVEAVCADELVLIAAPTHPIVSLGKVTLKDLAGLPFIVPEAASRTRQLLERKFREVGVPLKIAMQLPGTEGVKRGVEARLGVGMVSRYAVESECQTGVLQQVPVDGFRITRTMNLVHRSQKYFSPAGERFREFAKSYGERHLGQPLASTEGGSAAGPRGPGGARRAGGRARGPRGDRG